jgi:hypothetical protein
VLRAIGRLHFLTSFQVCRLLYSQGSHTYVQTRLKALADAGLLQRLFLPRPTAAGSGPRVYTLARPALRYLRAEGVEVGSRYRPAEHRIHSYLFLAHTLSVNDFLISLELLCRRHSALQLHTVLHERDLKRQPLQLDVEDGEPLAVIPDAWVDLRQGRTRTCLALEIDQGTLEQKAWRRKIRGLVKAMDGAYQERFNARSLIVAAVAIPGPARLAELTRWTEAELDVLRAHERAQLFRLTELPPASTPPERLFLLPSWVRPFSDEPVPLVALQVAEGGG